MQRKDGYVADIPYPPHFHKEMQPLWLAALTQISGASAVDLTKPYSYCELGCGMGINLLIAAATNPEGYFVGVDFNQHHLTIARAAVRSIGLQNIHFVQADFSQFAQENHFYFDFIACHGTWSWIAEPQQKNILHIVTQSLKPGGIFYLHYMCHPGATRLIPVQKILNDFAHQTIGTSVEKIQQGMLSLQQLVRAGIFVDQPLIEKQVEALAKKDLHYLAHEFLTDNWNPQHSSAVHQHMASAGLTYVASANALENVDALSVPGKLQPLLIDLPVALQETVRDLARNQHHRTDIFQRKNAASDKNSAIQLDDMTFQLLPGAPRSGNLTFNTPIGPIAGPDEIFVPLLQTLTTQPQSIAQLKQLPIFFNQAELLLQALSILMWAEHIHPQRKSEHSSNSSLLNKLKEWIAANSLSIEIIARCATAINRQTTMR